MDIEFYIPDIEQEELNPNALDDLQEPGGRRANAKEYLAIRLNERGNPAGELPQMSREELLDIYATKYL